MNLKMNKKTEERQREPIICHNCGKEFVPTKNNMVYCSTACRNKGYINKDFQRNEKLRLKKLKNDGIITAQEFEFEKSYIKCRVEHGMCNWCEHPDCIY